MADERISTDTIMLRVEELESIPEGKGKRELVQGKVVESSDAEKHVAPLLELAAVLADAAGKQNVVSRTGFILSRDPDVVRVPEVAVIADDIEPPKATQFRSIDRAPRLADKVLSADASVGTSRKKVRTISMPAPSWCGSLILKSLQSQSSAPIVLSITRPSNRRCQEHP